MMRLLLILFPPLVLLIVGLIGLHMLHLPKMGASFAACGLFLVAILLTQELIKINTDDSDDARPEEDLP